MKTINTDYNQIVQALISLLKSDPNFKDANFEASGVRTFINMLAYNTHFISAYAFMLNNESSIDSAQLMQSILSKSRGLGYLPRFKRSSRVDVNVVTEPMPFPERGYVVFHKMKSITGTSSRDSSKRYFSNPDDVYLYDYEEVSPGMFVFSSGLTTLMEGDVREWNFEVDESVVYQKFVIKDRDIDIDSIRVTVKESESDAGIAFKQAGSIFDVKENTNIFYITTTHDGYYEIYFGNNVFGTQPTDKQIINCTYLGTSGENGNGCTKFTFPGFGFVTSEMSNSGSDGETLETIRFNAINHFHRQNRIINEDDYRSVILSNFRNLKSINVWGGEENVPKFYGKVFLSVKPVYADVMSNSAKREMTQLLMNNLAKIGSDPVFVDPKFIECNVDIVLTTNTNATNASIKDIENDAINAVVDFNEQHLNVFKNELIDVDLNVAIKSSNVAIKSSYTRKTLELSVLVNNRSTSEYSVYFGNQIKPGLVESKMNLGIYNFNIFDDSNGILIAEDKSKKNARLEIGTVDYKQGLIKFTNPVSYNDGESNVKFKVTPVNPDVRSVLNNIVRINTVKVVDE